MLFKIETRNPFDGEIEHYAVKALNENEAKMNFTLEIPSLKIRKVVKLEGNVVSMKE